MNSAVIAALITTIVGGLFSIASIFLTFHLNRKGNKKDTQSVIQEVGKLSSKVDRLDTRVGSLENTVTSLENQMKELSTGTQQLLRYNLTEIYEQQKRRIDNPKCNQQYVPEEVSLQFSQMYEAYHKLGANGVMDDRKLWMDQHKEPPAVKLYQQEV